MPPEPRSVPEPREAGCEPVYDLGVSFLLLALRGSRGRIPRALRPHPRLVTVGAPPRSFSVLLLLVVGGALACGGGGDPSSDGPEREPTEQSGAAAGAPSGGRAPSVTGGISAVLGGTGGTTAQGSPGGSAGIAAAGSTASTTYPRPCADLYAESLFPSFEVEISEPEWEAMRQDCDDGVRQYRPIGFRYGAESVPAMMRLKGNWSWDCAKMQFVISFNETDPSGRFHGLRKLVLDAPWYDPTVLHERIAFEFMRGYGAPYSCVNNARLTINGEYYGLYANVERMDREYLERHFEDADGNLFSYDEGVELETNEDTGSTATADAFWAAETLAEVEALIEVPQALQVWAGLAMVPDPDSYWAGVEINFKLYEHPSRGLLFLPVDMDLSFGEEVWPELANADPLTYEHPEWTREVAYEVVLSDPTWCQDFEAAIIRAREAYDVAELTSRIELWSAQIASAMAEDPHRQYSEEEYEAAMADLRTFPQRRAEFVDAWLAQGSHCPPSFDQQGSWQGWP